MPSRAVSQRQQQVTRPWRVLFVVYAIALFTGTHWPRLDLDVGDLPAPDKILHMVGFAGLAFLLWRTQWITRTWLLLLVLLVWALLDEVTQAIPILGRTFSMLDVVGGWLGIVTVLIWRWALMPIGGPLNRTRCIMVEAVIDQLFLSRRTWLLAVIAGLAGACITGLPAGYLVMQVQPPSTLAAGLAAAIVGGATASLAVLDWLWRQERKRVISMRQCDRCGGSAEQVKFDEQGHGKCARCASPLHVGQWILLAPQPRRVQSSPLWHGVVSLIGAATFALAVYMFLHRSALHSPWLLNLMDRAAGSPAVAIPADLRLVIDLSTILFVLALAVRVYRETLARVVDQQDVRCMTCGHEVHATQTKQGVGRCGECGGSFVRYAPERDYGAAG
jgi:multisubunit Na+/H+ antiporter MnhC subunit/VanZ family protein